MIDFPEQDLAAFSERATVLAASWPQIREITLNPYLEDPDFTSEHKFVIVIQHNASFSGTEEGKFLEHLSDFLSKKTFSNKQYHECLIWPIGPDEPFPQHAVRDVSKTLYKREGTTEEALRQRTQPDDKMLKEKLRLEQEECDRRRDEYFKGSDIRISKKKKKEMATRLLLGRKPQPPISSLTDAEIGALRSSVKFPRGLTATEEARYWRVMARAAMESTDSMPELEQFTPETLVIPAPGHTDPEAFIRSLSVAYLSDTEVSIKVGTKKSKTYSHEDLGYKRENTKEWLALIQILKSKDHLFHVGVAHGKGGQRNKTYDAKRKTLREISKKFVQFLNKVYNQPLPVNFQIFERIKSDRSGTYGPKFTIPAFSADHADYSSYSQYDLMAEIEKLKEEMIPLMHRGDKGSEDRLQPMKEQMEAAVMVAVNKKWLGPIHLPLPKRSCARRTPSTANMALMAPRM